MSIHLSTGTILRLLAMAPGPGLKNNVDSYRGDTGVGMRNPSLERFLDELLDPDRTGIPTDTVDLLTNQLMATDPRMELTERQLRTEAIALLRQHGHEVSDEPVDRTARSLILDNDPKSLIQAGWRR